MSELNIATILSNTIAAILDEYTKPMLAHIAEQDERIAALQERTIKQGALIIELSNRIAAWQDTQPTQTTTNTQDLRILIDEIAHDLIHAAIEHHLEQTPHMTEDEVEEIADNKISDHCNDYDHDEFLTEIDEDTVRDAVRVCLEDARVSISIR